MALAFRPGSHQLRLVPCKGFILLVEDDPDLRAGLADKFEELGCTVVAAVDGADALARLGDSLRPCLVLLDLNMPRLDGMRLASHLRDHPVHRRLPLISMSAGEDRLAPPAVESHHTKPFDFQAMVSRVERFCQDPDWLHGVR